MQVIDLIVNVAWHLYFQSA